MHSSSRKEVELSSLSAIVFDFDGVFTDNFVYTDSDGRESVRTSREDSYGLALLRAYLKSANIHVPIFILSTETNPVVTMRAKKLNLDAVVGVNDKKRYLTDYFRDKSMPEGWANLMYFGNDLNDLGCMELAAFGMCPSDGHERIKAVSFYVAKKPGGSGFIREVIEFLLDSNSKRS